MKNILFVCTGNTCRSPMAAAIFWKLLQDRQLDSGQYTIDTAGLAAAEGMPPSAGALEAMRLEGLDISAHRSSQLTREQVQQADLILTMTRSHCLYIRNTFSKQSDRIHTLTEFAGETGMDITDPYGMGIHQYIQSAWEIKLVLNKIVDRLTAGEMDP